MYNNIGRKIKGLAVAFFIAESIGAFAGAIALIADDDDLIPVGVLIMLIGPLVAWVSSWLLYGFGELIDKASAIEYNTRNGNTVPTQVPAQPQSPAYTMPNVPTIAERMQKLAELRAKNLITEEEYNQAVLRLQQGGTA